MSLDLLAEKGDLDSFTADLKETCRDLYQLCNGIESKVMICFITLFPESRVTDLEKVFQLIKKEESKQ